MQEGGDGKMSSRASKPSTAARGFTLAELSFHAAVRQVRKNHGNAIIGLGVNIAQTLILVLVFYAMFMLLGFTSRGIRGDFLLFVMTGTFLFMCHVKTMQAVVGAEGPTSAMMKHAPMNTMVAIGAAALSQLYIQVLSMVVILFLYHAIWTPLEVHDPLGALLMLMLSWFTGVAIGIVLLGVKPWAPAAVSLIAQIYARVNMVASGKMFVASSLPGFLRVYFDWNPLFHTIDQARGFAFLNYSANTTTWTYPLIITAVALLLGLMGEFFTRRRASLSWGARV